MFRDRADAGLRLAWELSRYKNRKDALVLALPRGGMPVGAALARELDMPFNALLVAKLEHPDDRRTVIGAVSLTGLDVDPSAAGDGGDADEYLAAAVEKVRASLRQRYWSYHWAVRPTRAADRLVILTDDEAGSERPLLFAARRLRREGAARIIIAVPAATRDAYEALHRAADEVVCLRIVDASGQIADLYEDFGTVSEEEALSALRRQAAGPAPR